MEITELQYNNLLDFLDGNLTEEEMLVFEKKLGENKHLAAQLEFEEEVRNNIIVNEIYSKKDNKGNKLKLRKLLAPLAAAAVVCVCIIGYLILNKKKPLEVTEEQKIEKNKKEAYIIPEINDTNQNIIQNKKGTELAIETKKSINEKIFNEFYAKNDLPEDYPIEIAAEIDAYKKGNYIAFEQLNLESIKNTRGYGKDSSLFNLVHYYKGKAYLNNNNLPLATKNFEWLLKNSANSNFKADAYWYLGLIAIKNGDRKLSEKCFTEIRNYGRYKKNIEDVLERLKN